MNIPSILQRFLVTCLATLQLVLPGFAGVSMCTLGWSPEDCCCAPENPTPAATSCCSEENPAPASPSSISIENLKSECGCAENPASSPLRFPEMQGVEELEGLSPAILDVPVELQPAAPMHATSELRAAEPPADWLPLRVLFQVFRL